MSKILPILAGLVALALTVGGLAHQAHKTHHEEPHGNPEVGKGLALDKINEAYRKEVKPVFQKKCFDCHSSQTRYPWYQKIPGIKQMIQDDIAEAKMHLNMDPDFPFQSHASPLEDLDAIADSIEEREMPPFLYRMMHPDSVLTDEEREKVHHWVQLGRDLLKDSEK